MKGDAGNSCILYLAASAFLIIVQVISFMDFGIIFTGVAALSAVSVIIFMVQCLLFDRSDGGRTVQLLLTAAVGALTLIEILVLYFMGYMPLQYVPVLRNIAMYSFLTAACLVPMTVGFMILLRFRKRGLKILGAILVGFAVFAIALFFLSGSFMKVGVNDAAFTTYYADRALLSGHDPYSGSLNAGLYTALENRTINSVTFSTDGKIGGRTVAYPPLYLLLVAPFAAASGTLEGFSVALLYQEVAFALVLLAVVGYLGARSGSKRNAIIALCLILPFIFFTLISFVDMVMIAALLVAFFFPDRWYFGAALAVAASMQQLAWMPVILLLVYDFARSKPRKVARDIAIFGIATLAINIYPIVADGRSYVSTLLGNIGSGSVLPTSLSPIGTLLIRYLDIPLPYFHYLFYIGVGASLVLFLVLGRRRNFAILSLVPFLLLDFGRIEYYAVFIITAVVVAALEVPSKRSKESPALDGRIACLAIVVLGLAAIFVIALGHARYSSSFGVTVSGASATQDGNLSYSGNFSSGNFAGPLRVLLYTFSGNGTLTGVSLTNYTIGIYGPGGAEVKMVSGPGIPDNKVAVARSGPARLTISQYNDTGIYAECVIYSITDFYICPPSRVGQNR
ncbi:MAG: DUF2029 domain-containing protein [Candidatus Micrarchaeota archaeon]|nr:DUF2029 domain-containing protein [Candidatus Micrarchaeota archaeon]